MGGTAGGAAPTTSPGSAPAGGSQRGGTLAVGALAPSTEVDPVAGFDGASIAVFQLVNEYLIWLEPDFTLRPQLAESWEPSADGATWTVALRKGVAFSDGRPLTANDVVTTFARLLAEDSGSAARTAFDGVLAADGVSAKDDATVVFTLQRPYGDFPYLISAGTYNAVILKSDYAGDYTKSAIGTGPFTLTSFSATEGAKFARNESYWDAGKPYLDGVEIKFYQDLQSQFVGLQSGEVDTQVTSQVSLLAPLEGNDEYTVDQVSGTGVTVFTLRVDAAPFDKPEVREAIATALDRTAIITTLSSGLNTIGNDHLIAPAYPAAPTDIAQRELDKAKVTGLLTKAGVPDLSFKLTFEPPTKDYAVVIQEQLRQAGITVELDQRTSEEFYAGDQEKDTPWLFTPANLVAWAGRAVPTQFIIPMVKTGGIWNGSKYANPKLDAAADAYDAATDDAEKKAQAKIMAEALHGDVPIIITSWTTAVRPSRSSKWSGISAHPSAYVDFTNVSQV
jgi:peptide/nickel transport system substrate-binding protein